MKAFHIHDAITLLKELVCKKPGLVEIASGIVPEVEYEPLHSLLYKRGSGRSEFRIGRPGEFRKLDVSCSIVDHEGCIDAVDRNLIPHDIERNDGTVAIDRYLHLRTFRAFHEPYHAVLRHLDTCHDPVIDLYDPVALKKTCLLGRTAWQRVKDDGRIVRDIECNAYTFEIAGKLSLRFGKFNRRKIHGMRIKLCQRSHNSSIRHILHIDRVHIILLDLLKYEVQFTPPVVVSVKLLFRQGLYDN